MDMDGSKFKILIALVILGMILYYLKYISLYGLMYGLLCLLCLFFMLTYNENRLLTFEEARKIAYEHVLKMQKDNELPTGRLELLPDTALQYARDRNGNIEPFRWLVGYVIEGSELQEYCIYVTAYAPGRVLHNERKDIGWQLEDEKLFIEIEGEKVIEETKKEVSKNE
ncbi:MAG: hypothetical protein QW469_01150 [Candidatus Aenigmatarchaeota archaeon]